MARRQRIDSNAGIEAAVVASFRQIVPPEHVALDACDMPFWQSVVDEFPKSEWTVHQLEVAAQLAKTMSDLESERAALRIEGYVIDGKANPRHGVARDLTNSIMSLRRNLSLHARVKQGEAVVVAERRNSTKEIEAGASTTDDLIPRPSYQ